MFYIKEIYLRLVYLILVLFFLFYIYYQYREITFVIFLIPSKLMGYELVEHFIYTNPTELIYSFLTLNFFFIILFLTPYTLWIFLDFLKPGLFINEYTKLNFYTKSFNITAVLINIILFIVIFPIIFKFFQSFNIMDLKNLDIKFELKIIEFVYFIYNVFYIINTALTCLMVLLLIIVFNGISFYIQHKKFFIIIGLIAATLISTPDIVSQITLFVIINLTLEFFQFIIIYKNKFNMASC